MVVYWDRDTSPHGSLQYPEEIRVWFRGLGNERDHFSWQAEGSAVEQLSGGGIRVFAPGCPDPQHGHRQLVHPGGSLEARPQGTLEVPVETFHKSICLRVVGGGGLVPNA